MPDRFQASHIRRVPLFQTLPEPQFNLVAQTFQVRRYHPGEVIFYQGNPTTGLQILVEGQAVLLQATPEGRAQHVGTLREGQAINQNAIFQDGIESATLQAVQNVTLLILTRNAMASLLAHHPEIAQSLGLQGRRDHHIHEVHFKTQREDEEVLLKTRRHWWAYVRWLWIPILLMVPFWALTAAQTALAPILIPISLLLPGLAAGYLYLEWANDSVFITNQRIVRITHTILTFSEVRDEVALDSIQEANAEIPALDPFALILRYGNVEMKTAGREGDFILNFMPNPRKLQRLIMEDHQKHVARKTEREKEAMRAEIDRWISGNRPASTATMQPRAGERIWKVGDGPLSPFISSFKAEGGATVYRKHWSIWMSRVTLPVLWIMATFTFMVLLLVLSFLQALGVIGWAIAIVMLLVGTLWFYFVDWDWRHDYYVVTDSNITIINQRPLWLQSEKDQILLKQVDNVVSETHGISQRILKYGDVKVALVGADAPKIFHNVANPLDVQSEISRRQARLKQQGEQQSAQQQREIIGEYLSLYHETVGSQEDGLPEAPPQHETLRDRSRPPLVPRQRPPRPSMSTGRPYQPDQSQQPYPTPGQQPPYPTSQPYPGSEQQSYPTQQPYYPQAQQPDYPTQQQPQRPPNINPPQPPRRDSGRPPKFPPRRNN